MEPLWILRCFIFYIVINPLFQVHTFEEVIMTLQRAVDCDRNQVPSHVIYDISNTDRILLVIFVRAYFVLERTSE